MYISGKAKVEYKIKTVNTVSPPSPWKIILTFSFVIFHSLKMASLSLCGHTEP